MKNIFLSIFAMTCLLSKITAQQAVQQNRLPAAVQQQFNANYKNPRNPEWWMKDQTYRVMFGMEGKKQLVEFDSSGGTIATGIQVLQADLPSSIGHDVKEKYENRRIRETYKVERSGNTIYMVKLKGEPPVILFYGEDGKPSNVNAENW
jgi:hypothetical protein